MRPGLFFDLEKKEDLSNELGIVYKELLLKCKSNLKECHSYLKDKKHSKTCKGKRMDV